MEELKEATYTESSVQTSTDSPASTDSPTSTDSPNTELNQSQEISYDEMQNISQVIPIDNETPKKSQVTLVDETQNNTQEIAVETPSEPIEIKTEDANTTNCLALTIQADHRLVAFKNVLSRSIRMSWKVVVSTITLALIKLFS